jgi:poly(3-hydroxybutyrate) depolymerase
MQENARKEESIEGRRKIRMKKGKLAVFLPYMLTAAMAAGTVSPAVAYAKPVLSPGEIDTVTTFDDMGIDKLAEMIGGDVNVGDANVKTSLLRWPWLPVREAPAAETSEAGYPEGDDPAQNETGQNDPGQGNPWQRGQAGEEPSTDDKSEEPIDWTKTEVRESEEQEPEVQESTAQESEAPAADPEPTAQDPRAQESTEQEPEAQESTAQESEAPATDPETAGETLTQEETAEEPATQESSVDPGEPADPGSLGTPVNLMSYDLSSVKVSEEPNRLALTGYFTIDVEARRSVKVYIPEGAPIAAYFTVIEVPEGVDTAEFLIASGWKQYADSMEEGLYVLEPGRNGYEGYEAEKAYVEAAMKWLISPVIGVTPVFSTYGIFNFVGYGEQAAALEAWCAKNPSRVIAQAYAGSDGVPLDELEQIGRTPMGEVGRTPFVIEDDLKMTYSQITIPTYYITDSVSSIHSLDYWKAANDVTSEAKIMNGAVLYYQKLDSERWQTTMWNKLFSRYPQISGGNGLSAVGFRKVEKYDYASYGDEIRQFLSRYMSYDFSTEYNKQLSYRPDWDELGVKIMTTTIEPVKGHAKREYIVYAPEGCEEAWGNAGAPLVLVEAGAGTTDRNFFNASQWWLAALSENFIVVFLCEDNNTPTTLTYRDTDIFMDKVLEEVTAAYKVDESRIYLTGHSAGSGVSQAIGILYPERFAAIASTSAVPDVQNIAESYEGMFGGAGRKYGSASLAPVPVMFMYGEGDRPELHDGIWYSSHKDSQYYSEADEGKSIEALTRYHLAIWGLEMGEEAKNSTQQYSFRTNVSKDRQHGYESWTWSVDVEGEKIPVYRVNRMQNIGHTNSNTEFPILWDYLEHFSIKDGVRYYSESSFKENDAVAIIDSDRDALLREYVGRLYRDFLGREPDTKGLLNWVIMLREGRCSASTLLKGFVFSAEFKANPLDDEAYIRALYTTVLGREADEGGLSSWQNVLNMGCTRKKVFEGFVHSEELDELADRLGIAHGAYVSEEIVDRNYKVTSFVGRLYWSCFNRKPDKGGLEAWVKALVEHRATGSDVAWGFFDSTEFRNAQWDNESYIYFLYYTMLGRTPDDEGYSTWSRALREGASRKSVYDGFAKSVEFGRLCEEAGIDR